jgi:glycosyltransferase involved in cell wall biosynthesis
MKIIISAGGRFHAIQLACQMATRKNLLNFFSFSYTKKDALFLDKSNVSVIRSCKILDMLFLKLRLYRFMNPSIFNNFKDDFFDNLVNKQLKKFPSFDLFVGWSHYSLRSMQTARKKGAIIVIESGSSHIQEQQQLLEEEYKKWNITFNPIHPDVIAKMTYEYECTDYIMTLSTASRTSFIKHGISPQKLLQSTCGIDVDYFLSQPKELNRDKKFRVIFVGLVNLRKGIPYLIEAWNKINLPASLSELVIVGPIQKDMAQLLPQLTLKKNIVFYGPTNRETLKKIYYQSSLFVLPSVEDGFGMVMGEAMACGLPVICSTNTGAPDVIDDRIHGFLVPPQNSCVLAEKIGWFYKHQFACKNMGNEGRRRILDFTWNNYGENINNIYQKILNPKCLKENSEDL